MFEHLFAPNKIRDMERKTMNYFAGYGKREWRRKTGQ